VESVIREFLEFKRKERRAWGTISFYEECLSHYKKDGKWPPSQDDVLDFLSHLVDGKHHKPRSSESAEQTYGRYFRALRAFFRFCVDRGYLDKNPMEKIKAKTPKLTLPILPPPEKLARLNKIPGIRDRAVIALMLETGIRPRELITLREDKIDWNHSFLIVNGKTGSRPVPFRQTVHRLLLQYYRVRRNPYNSPYFFLSRTGEQLTLRCLNAIFQKAKKILGIEGKFYPYLCRHIFATFSLRFGGNIDDIRRVLGHSNYDIIRVYLNQTMDDVARSQAVWSVMENLKKRR